jgi:hypothetical protein
MVGFDKFRVSLPEMRLHLTIPPFILDTQKDYITLPNTISILLNELFRNLLRSVNLYTIA